jgi:hypothetical protein
VIEDAGDRPDTVLGSAENPYAAGRASFLDALDVDALDVGRDTDGIVLAPPHSISRC